MTTVVEESVESDCLSDFEPWFNSVIERTRPDLIVAIARGAARLLQMHGLISGRLPIPVFSHHALPFLPDSEVRGHRVLLFDDSVIYGSTMAEVSEYLAGRGSLVTHCAYAVDRRTFFGDDGYSPSPFVALQPKVNIQLEPDDVPRHHASLVQEIFDAGLDLNLDFPSITVTLNAFKAEEIPYLARLLTSRPIFHRLENVTFPVAHHSEVQRWTALHDSYPCRIDSSEVMSRGHCKTRVTFVPERRQLCLTPIVQYAIRSGTSLASVRFSVPEIDLLWRMLELTIFDSTGRADAALLRALTFFGATVFGDQVVREIETAVSGEFSIESIDFEPNDPLLILGPVLAGRLNEVWNRLRATFIPLVSLSTDRSQPLTWVNEELKERIRGYFNTHPEFCPSSSDTPVEALGKVFLAIQRVTDSTEMRQRAPQSRRLSVGLTYDDIREILCGYAATFTLNEISLAVDYCVDRALAVPKVIEFGGWCFRAFYCGEDSENEPGEQLRNKLFEVAGELQKTNAKPFTITPFDMHKICACVKHVCDFFPVEVAPGQFGMTCAVGEKSLIDWLTPIHNPPFLEKQEKRTVRGRKEYTRRKLLRNAAFASQFKPTWSHEEEHRFFSTFKNLQGIFSRISVDGKLLLSTCGTASRTFQAIAYELHAWAGSVQEGHIQSKSFANMIFAARTDVSESGSGKLQPDVIERLYWNVVYVTEAKKKYRIWTSDYEKIRSECIEQISDVPDVRRWWLTVGERALLNRELSATYDGLFKELKELIGQTEVLTQAVVRAMVESGKLSQDRLVEEWRHHHLDVKQLSEFRDYCGRKYSDAANAYNTRLSMLRSMYRFELSGKLPPSGLPGTPGHQKAWLYEKLESAQKCAEELRATICTIAPLAYTASKAFHCDIGEVRSMLLDGTRRIPRDDVFTLVSAVTGAPAEVEGSFRNSVLEVLCRRVDDKLVWDAERQQVLVVVCSGYISRIWSFAKEIYALWKSWPEQAGGAQLVQAVTFGSVTEERRSDDTLRLVDRSDGYCISLAKELTSRASDHGVVDPGTFQLIMTKSAWLRSKELEQAGVLPYHPFAVNQMGSRCIAFFLSEASLSKPATKFNVFLCHNSSEKPTVKDLGERLKATGVTVWLDEWELVPGQPWRKALEDIIETTESVGVLVGKDGVGPWQDQELSACLSEFVKRGLPVIPVLMPGASYQPALPLFLRQFTWVDLRGGFTKEGLDNLRWGITGTKPGSSLIQQRECNSVVPAFEQGNAPAKQQVGAGLVGHASAPRPDVLLVTVNEHETRAVHDAFEAATGAPAATVPLDGRVYRNLGRLNGTTVYHALSDMGSSSVGAMQQTVDKAIRALDPGAVIAIGVAFGVNEKKQAIGDILLSRQLRPYDLQRMGSEITLRGDKPHATPRLIDHFHGFALTAWQGAKVRPGVILTGDKLIDDIDYRDKLLVLEEEAVGGEMEGAGLYVPCYEHKVDWIVIKAICDWADGDKAKNKSARQKKAAANAVQFLIGALQYAPLKHQK